MLARFQARDAVRTAPRLKRLLLVLETAPVHCIEYGHLDRVIDGAKSALQQMLALILLLLLAPVAGALAAEDEAAEEVSVQWMAMLLDGSKTGYMKLERELYRNHVINRETVVLQLNRGESNIEIRTVDESKETRDGRPLAFSSLQSISGGEMRIDGSVDASGLVTVTSNSAGSVQHQTFQWDPEALMPEGLRLMTLKAGLKPGTSLSAKVFVAGSLQSFAVTMKIMEPEIIDLFGVEASLYRVEQTMMIGQTPTTAIAWVDENYDVKKMNLNIMGMQLQTIACPEECAKSPAQPTQFFSAALARAPRAITIADRNGAIRYQIVAKDGQRELHFPSSSEQQVLYDEADGSYQVTVSTRPLKQPPPTAEPAGDQEYLKQTRWLQAQAPEVVRLAERARGDAQGRADIMTSLQNFVRDYVHDKNLSVGYASALEVAQNRSGDCTEHALLLAAMGRALGIPTRIATGLTYVEHWLGQRQVFVPHAWTQALVDGHWISYDAAIGQFDAGHIALGYGNGDPWRFFEGANILGNIEIVAAQPINASP